MRECMKLVGSFAFGYSALFIGAPHANAATIDNGSVSTIVGVDAGLCLGVNGSNSVPGAQLQSQSCTGSNFQKWKFNRDSAGYFEVVNAGSGQCIDVTGGSSSNGAAMQQWNCSGADYQKWKLTDQGSGQFAITSKYNGLALEVYNFSKANGSRVGQWSWVGGSNQKWAIATGASSAGLPTHGSVITLTGMRAGSCLGVTNSSTASGAKMQAQACSGSAFQQWKVTLDGAGDYGFVNVGSGLCMDVPGASTVAGAVIQQWGCGGAEWQKWRFHADGAGRYYITSKVSGLALDEDIVTKAGTVLQWAYAGSTNQRWAVTAPASASAPKPPSAAEPEAAPTAEDSTETVSALSAGAGSGKPTGFAAGTTGGKGGQVVHVSTAEQLKKALCSTTWDGCTDHTPRIIVVDTMIDATEGEPVSYTTSCVRPEAIDLACPRKYTYERTLILSQNEAARCEKKNGAQDIDTRTPYKDATGMLVGSNKTIIGKDKYAGIKGRGLWLKGDVSNIIIRNLSFTDMNYGKVFGADAITIWGATKVWIDHNYFARIGRQFIVTGFGNVDGLTISNNEFDGTTDFRCDRSHYWNFLLLAPKGNVTFQGNWFHNFSGRGPDLGGGSFYHFVNNLFDTTPNSAQAHAFEIGHSDHPEERLQALIEGNYFKDVRNPISGPAAAPFYGLWKQNAATQSSCKAALGRLCSGNGFDESRPHPTNEYADVDYMRQDSVVLSTAKSLAGGLVKPYSASRVLNTVRANAGVGYIADVNLP